VPSAGTPNGVNPYVIRQDYDYVFHMQNVSSGVNAACIAGTNNDEQWKCFFAQYTMPFLQTPTFVVVVPFRRTFY
jgi:hypothetical protein